MTHDELTERLDIIVGSYIDKNYGKCAGDILDSIQALRAVVELHKPFTEFGAASCEACFNADYSHKDQPYPCTTIQAIEKELK